MSLRRRKHDIYLDRPLIPAQEETPEKGFHQGRSPVELLKDAEIESERYRLALLDGEGDISIIVAAGDELGDIRVGVQFEGEKGKYDQCLARQGELLDDVLRWLQELYAKFPGRFEMDVVSQPCPKGDSRLLVSAERRQEVAVKPSPGLLNEETLAVKAEIE